MKKSSLLLTTAVLGFVSFAYANSASAQSSYQPARPTFSPYFSYFQVNTTGLPNYQTFIAPERRIRAQFQQEQARIRSVEQTGIRLQRDVTRLAVGGLVRQTDATRRVVPAATFLNYSGFYPQQQAARRRR